MPKSTSMHLHYQPPFLWDRLLGFLAGRAITGVEVVANDEYQRTVRVAAPDREQVLGWIRVGNQPQRQALIVTVSESLTPVLGQVLARVQHLFDLGCDPQLVFGALARMNDIRPGLCVEGTRVPGCFDPFEMAVRAVLGQQITVKAASTLAARIVAAFGVPVETGIEGLTHVFPSAEQILALAGPLENQLGPLGVTSARSRTIRGLAQALVQGDISLDPWLQPDDSLLPVTPPGPTDPLQPVDPLQPGQSLQPVDPLHLADLTGPETQMARLMDIKGIGTWTANYLAMRALGYKDAFLETDIGVRKALEGYTSHALLHMAEAWRPWRSYATINLWNSRVQ